MNISEQFKNAEELYLLINYRENEIKEINKEIENIDLAKEELFAEKEAKFAKIEEKKQAIKNYKGQMNMFTDSASKKNLDKHMLTGLNLDLEEAEKEYKEYTENIFPDKANLLLIRLEEKENNLNDTRELLGMHKDELNKIHSELMKYKEIEKLYDSAVLEKIKEKEENIHAVNFVYKDLVSSKFDEIEKRRGNVLDISNLLEEQEQYLYSESLDKMLKGKNQKQQDIAYKYLEDKEKEITKDIYSKSEDLLTPEELAYKKIKDEQINEYINKINEIIKELDTDEDKEQEEKEFSEGTENNKEAEEKINKLQELEKLFIELEEKGLTEEKKQILEEYNLRANDAMNKKYVYNISKEAVEEQINLYKYKRYNKITDPKKIDRYKESEIYNAEYERREAINFALDQNKDKIEEYADKLINDPELQNGIRVYFERYPGSRVRNILEASEIPEKMKRHAVVELITEYEQQNIRQDMGKIEDRYKRAYQNVYERLKEFGHKKTRKKENNPEKQNKKEEDKSKQDQTKKEQSKSDNFNQTEWRDSKEASEEPLRNKKTTRVFHGEDYMKNISIDELKKLLEERAKPKEGKFKKMKRWFSDKFNSFSSYDEFEQEQDQEPKTEKTKSEENTREYQEDRRKTEESKEEQAQETQEKEYQELNEQEKNNFNKNKEEYEEKIRQIFRDKIEQSANEEYEKVGKDKDDIEYER